MPSLPSSSTSSESAGGGWELVGSNSAVAATEAAECQAVPEVEASELASALGNESECPPPQDSTPEEASATPPHVQECIVVCVDRSGSMGTPFNEEVVNWVKGAKQQRTRMEAVKVMFYAFRDRAESLGSDGGGFEMGLIQFDEKVDRLLELTPQLDLFEKHIDDMQKRGQTAIFSAIAEAASMLEERFKQDKRIDLRVLVLTDGQNNIGASPLEALSAVNRIGAIVDAILVGNRPDSNLRKIVSATGGECYQINDLGDGFELLEQESVVSLRARRGGLEKPAFSERPLPDFDELKEKHIASRQPPPTANAATIPKSVMGAGAFVSGAGEVVNCGKPVVKRIMKELRSLASSDENVWVGKGDGIHVFPSPENIKFWRALIEGPIGSPFEDGVFVLNINIPDDYPFTAPKIVFETPVYHCNVSDAGGICLDIFKEKWTPALTVPKCLESIRMMLADPNPDDAMRSWIAELFMMHQKTEGKDTRYVEKAREATKQNASKTVEEWKHTWGCSS